MPRQVKNVDRSFEMATKENIPMVDIFMLVDFVKGNPDFHSSETRGWKDQRAMRQCYSSEAVGYVQLKREPGRCHVKAELTPEHRIRSAGYVVHAEIEESSAEGNTILSCKCQDCPAAAGEGSYAKVYLTVHTRPGKPDQTLACKVINAKKAPREYVTKFLPRELDILGKVSHPNIIHTDAIFNRNNKFLIFMRYAENGDLLEYVLRRGEVKESVARVWLYQLCLATQYLHVLDIAHRDIKCENILISANYNIKLADFGFARFVTVNGKQVLSSTYCGSLIYASPEILKGKPYYPKCSDVWSLGIVTYIMLNKSMPFSETNTRQLYKLQMERQWNFRRKIAPTLSPGVIGIVGKMLEPNFKARVTVDDIVEDRYFHQNGLDMTETEKMALTYASKHKHSVQMQKKINLSDMAMFQEDREAFYSTMGVVRTSSMALVTEQTTTAAPPPKGPSPHQMEQHGTKTHMSVPRTEESPTPGPDEIIVPMEKQHSAPSPVRETRTSMT